MSQRRRIYPLSFVTCHHHVLSVQEILLYQIGEENQSLSLGFLSKGIQSHSCSFMAQRKGSP
jgi:hypothetical protein